MPKIAIGADELAALYVGTDEVVAAYIGADEVYSAGEAEGNDANTVFLCQFDGADEATSASDIASGGAGNPHAIAFSGDAQLDDAQTVLGLGTSLLVQGSNDWVGMADHADFEYGTGDFTIDLWARPANTTQTTADILSKRPNGAAPTPWLLRQNGTSWAWALASASAWDIMSPTNAGTASGAWQHLAIERDGTTFTLFVDGVPVDTHTSSSSLNNNAEDVRLGVGASDGSQDWAGHIGPARFSKVARYGGASFTPPAAPYG